MRIAEAGVLAFLFARAAAGAQTPPVQPEVAGSVVFVCEHGNVKSLIASEWFNRLASERGLKLRASSRGLSPDATVPGPIAAHLRDDGFDVAAFQPRPFVASDLRSGIRIVMIGAAPPSFASAGGVRVERWDGVPPASEGYAASRDALRARLAKLLDELAPRGPAP